MAKKQNDDADDSFEGGDGAVMVDLNNVEDMSVVPKGRYPGIITSCEYGLSQSSGKPMWTIKATINDGEYDGRNLYGHLSFSEKALPMTKKSIVAIAPELLNGPFNPEERAGDLVNKPCTVIVSTEKYEGEERSRIRSFAPPKEGGAFM